MYEEALNHMSSDRPLWAKTWLILKLFFGMKILNDSNNGIVKPFLAGKYLSFLNCIDQQKYTLFPLEM